MPCGGFHSRVGDGRSRCFVFACGPWLPGLFPDVAGAAIATSRQEVLYFGTAPGDARFTTGELPVWMDFAAGSRAGQVYGVPASGSSGFKVADDTPGPPIDPSGGERIVSGGGGEGACVSIAPVSRPGERPGDWLRSLSIREHARRPFGGRSPSAGVHVWIVVAAPATASSWVPPWAR